MEKFSAICKITWNFDGKIITEYRVYTNVKNFTNAAELVEEDYGDDLLSLEITLTDEPVLMPKEEYEIKINEVIGELV